MALSFKQGSPARSYVIFAILLVVCIVCMVMYGREGSQGPLHTAQSTISGLFAPVKAASGGISTAEDAIGGAITDATADPSTLSALREQNQQLRSTIAQLEEYRQEAERLEGVLALRDAFSATAVTGRVLSRSLDPWNLVVTIDVGTNDGVRAGMPVLGSSGLVGQVIAATPFTADVRLLADPQSGVAVMVQSSRDEGILRGNLDGLLYLEDMDEDAQVQAGDVVITSGLGGGFFRGIMVGTVVKVDERPGSVERTVVVEPNASTAAYEEATVIISMDSDAAEAAVERQAAIANGQAASTDGASSSEGASSQEAGTQDGTASGYDPDGGYAEDGSAGTGYDGEGLSLRGKYPHQPDLAASALWSTPRELLAIAKAFIEAYHGRSAFLQEASAREMAKRVEKFPWTGLGVFPQGEDIIMSQGWGENGQCMLKMNLRTCAACAVMTNRNPETDQAESGVEWLVDSIMGSATQGS